MTTQTMNTFETLDLEALANVEGGGWVKCYAGTIGSALVGSAGGPVGYWGRSFSWLRHILLIFR